MFLLAAGTPATAQVTLYGATLHESRWETTRSRMQCTLRHSIPGYGQAQFAQNAGEGLTFHLHPSNPSPATQEVALYSTPPAWRHGVANRHLPGTPATTKQGDITLHGEPALQLLGELTRGMVPTFDITTSRQGQTTRLTLSPVRLRPAQTEFTACTANLLPYSYAQIRRSQLQFDFGSSALLPEARARADQLVEFIRENPDIRRIRIDGHTDNIGRSRYNQALGQRRAEALKDYLLAKGIEEEMIVLRSYGERKPQSSNRTPAGRAINRRVLVTLER